MSSLFDGTEYMDDIEKIYDQMETNCPNPRSTSKELWKLRCACHIAPHNRAPETLIEKAVAMLAENGYMYEWFNQCPTASGITDSSRDRRSNVDLVRWLESTRRAHLVELKWESDDPPSALRQILGYGAAYIFCRVHKGSLTFPAESLIEMNARHVSLEVIAPPHFYHGYDERARIARMSQTLDEFAGSKINGLSMSLKALAFPEEFKVPPFGNGEEVKNKCDSRQLTAEGRKVRDAFDKLAPVWPTS